MTLCKHMTVCRLYFPMARGALHVVTRLRQSRSTSIAGPNTIPDNITQCHIICAYSVVLQPENPTHMVHAHAYILVVSPRKPRSTSDQPIFINPPQKHLVKLCGRNNNNMAGIQMLHLQSRIYIFCYMTMTARVRTIPYRTVPYTRRAGKKSKQKRYAKTLPHKFIKPRFSFRSFSLSCP